MVLNCPLLIDWIWWKAIKLQLNGHFQWIYGHWNVDILVYYEINALRRIVCFNFSEMCWCFHLLEPYVLLRAMHSLSTHSHTRQHSIHFFFHFRHKQKSSQCLPNSKHVYLYIYWNSQFFNVNIWNCARHIAFQHTHFIKACLTGPMLCDSSVSPCMLFSFIFFPFVVRCAETIKHSTDCCRNPAHYVYCWRLCVWAYQKPELEWQHLLFWCCNIHVGALFLLFSVCFCVCVMSATLG